MVVLSILIFKHGLPVFRCLSAYIFLSKPILKPVFHCAGNPCRFTPIHLLDVHRARIIYPRPT